MKNALVTVKDAFNAIMSEREYQQRRWGSVATAENKPLVQTSFGVEPAHEVESFILYMEHYLSEARRLASTCAGGVGPDGQSALDFVRKVAGLAVCCMEQHGAPKR